MTVSAADQTDAGAVPAQTNALVAEKSSADVTSAPPHKQGLSIVIGHGEEDRPPLTKETLDRLTPEQVLDLEKARQSTSIGTVVTAIGFFAIAPVIVLLVLMFRYKRAREVQATLRLMIEKGTPIPPELLTPPDPRPRPKSDLRGGLVLSGLGIGLSLFLLSREHDAWGVGLIPLLMGVGLLIAWKIESKKTQ